MSDKKNPFIRPFLKWAGGKRQLKGDILPIIRSETIGTYYEPFVGGGAILFGLKPQSPVINDLNEQLIITYRVIKENVDELIEVLKTHREKNSSEYFYELRGYDRTPEFDKKSDVEKAARLIYLNKTCYNGLYRVNSQGFFNTPYGRYENPKIYEEEVLKAVHSYFVKNNIVIKNENFDSAVKNAKEGDYVYLDPPYDSLDCTNFTGYQAGGFDQEQQKKLKTLMEKLRDRNVKCLQSNAETEFIKELYSDFPTRTIKAKRMIGSNADTRGLVDEILIKNYDTPNDSNWSVKK